MARRTNLNLFKRAADHNDWAAHNNHSCAISLVPGSDVESVDFPTMQYVTSREYLRLLFTSPGMRVLVRVSLNCHQGSSISPIKTPLRIACMPWQHAHNTCDIHYNYYYDIYIEIIVVILIHKYIGLS
jgi:hypothetical protein